MGSIIHCALATGINVIILSNLSAEVAIINEAIINPGLATRSTVVN